MNIERTHKEIGVPVNLAPNWHIDHVSGGWGTGIYVSTVHRSNLAHLFSSDPSSDMAAVSVRTQPLAKS